MPYSAHEHDYIVPLPPETHTYDVVYVAEKRGRIEIVEPDTIEKCLDRLNEDDGDVLDGVLDQPDCRLVRVREYSPAQTQLELIISSCLLSPNPQSQEYLDIIESFHEFRAKHGTPDTLAMIFRLGQLNPTK